MGERGGFLDTARFFLAINEARVVSSAAAIGVLFLHDVLRGVIGNFHHISRKHLGRYVAEFDFRWNSRKATDGQRTVAGIKKAQGKRLMMNVNNIEC